MKRNKEIFKIVDASIIKELHNTIDSEIEINKCMDTIILLQTVNRSTFKDKNNDLKNSESNKHSKIGSKDTILDIGTINYFSNNHTGLVYLTSQKHKNGREYITLRTELDKTIITTTGNEVDIPMEIKRKDGNQRNNNYENLQLITMECSQDIRNAEYMNKIRGGN